MRYLVFASICLALNAVQLPAAAAGPAGKCKQAGQQAGQQVAPCKPQPSKRDHGISAADWEKNERALQLNILQSAQSSRNR